MHPRAVAYLLLVSISLTGFMAYQLNALNVRIKHLTFEVSGVGIFCEHQEEN